MTTEDPVAAIDPFGDDIVVTSPTECFDNTTATVPDYGPSGWTCTDSWAAANADLAVPDHGADGSSPTGVGGGTSSGPPSSRSSPPSGAGCRADVTRWG